LVSEVIATGGMVNIANMLDKYRDKYSTGNFKKILIALEKIKD